MAFVYRNIWLDLTWSLLLSPSHFKLALHEAIEGILRENAMQFFKLETKKRLGRRIS
jgi:uncharacterized protein